MSDTVGERSIPMVCATGVMKPGPTRIGKIGKTVTLPRTIPIATLFASGIGATLGIFFALTFGSASNIPVGIGIGGGLGWLLVSYSPLRNESLLKWFELTFKSQTRSRYVKGRRVIPAVGVAVVKAPSSGPVILRRSATRVPIGHYDERGVPRTAKNLNLPQHSNDPALWHHAAAPEHGARHLPGFETGHPSKKNNSTKTLTKS